jgi:type VI secretion system protein ImpL
MAAAAQPAAQPQYVGTKRVPQWLFLSRLFHHVILQDRVALSTSGASTKTSTLQRILLGTVALLFLGLAIGFTVSFFRNRTLVNEAAAASTGFSGVTADAGGPSVPDLQKLASLRGVLQQLTGFRVNGRPFSMGWGLYTGDELYPRVRANYYKHFAQLLFGHAQGALKAHMDALPASPGPNDDYGTAYEVLKGYLITTSHSDKVSADSPAPILLRKWSETRNIQDQRKDLANAEFQFYASDLKNGNPYSTNADRASVEHARDYLNQFSGIERVYQYMLSSAGKKSVNYNRDVPGSSQAVINNRDVAGAFTKAGYDFMQDALQKADKYFGGEQWVLERTRKDNVDTSKLKAELSARYVRDFIAQWRNYFRNTNVLGYSSLADAAQKLNLHTGTQSPILGVFWLAAQNTGVDYTKIQGADAIRKAFQPVHRVVPPGNAERYSAPTNKPYTDGLLSLQQAVDAAKNAPVPDGTAIAGSASTAKMAVKQMALEFDIDPEARLNATVQKLLEDPIISAEDLVKSLGPRELNAKGKAFCDTFDPIFRKFPFNPAATAEATGQEVSALLKPGEGALWQFYQASLQKGLVKVGSEYRPNGELPLTPGFVTFFNNAARLSEAFFKSGADPRLTYTVRPVMVQGIQNLTMVLDGQALEASNTQGKQINWPGAGQGSRFTGKIGSADLPVTDQVGLWSAFRLFQLAERIEPAGSGYNLDFLLQVTFGRTAVATANAPTARFFVDLGGANVLLRKSGGGLNCVRQVAK